MSQLKSCPFCGETEDLEVITAVKKMNIRDDGTFDRMTQAHVQCGHCAARGSSLIETTREEAVLGVTQYWNQAGRPTWWHMNARRPWLGFCNDVREFVSGGYDRRATLKALWGWVRR